MKNTLLLLFVSFFCTQIVLGQDKSIKGTVVSATDNEPIIGASIQVKGATGGTITDLDGHFRLNVASNAVLVVSYVGFSTAEVPVNNQLDLKIKLKEDIQTLSDVVVIGYGTQKKADLSSAIAILPVKDLAKVPGGLQAGLQSTVPGVQVTNGRIRIRGVGSINNTDPLYVVDGMIGGAVPDESNISSIQVLKDAASCAIYGARGANGVILVTTQRGQTGPIKVTYNGYAGVKNLSHDIKRLNGQDLAELINEAMYNANPSRTDYLKGLSDPAAIGKGYDMFKELQRTGNYQKHNLSISGGSENATFRINGIYSTDKPIFIKEDYENFAVQFISDWKKGRFKLGETVRIGRDLHDWSDKNLLIAQKWSSTVPLYDPESSTGFAGAGNGTDCESSLAEAHLNWHKGESLSVNGNAWVSFDILDGLTYKFNLGADMYRYHVQDYKPEYSVGQYQNYKPDSYGLSTDRNNRFLYENTLTYDKAFGKHAINVLAGVTSEESKNIRFNASARAMPSPDILILGATKDDGSKNIGSGFYNSAMFSILGRINYSYDSKYMVTANFRRDGSSNFSKKHRYGNFPSLSAAWRISQENFMKKLPWISDLKLRASWGLLGNSNISQYQYQSTVTFGKVWYYLNDDKTTGAIPLTPSNPSVKWESQYSTDIGLDLSLFDNRLSFIIDYYNKKTEDMLVQVPISYSAGYMGNFPTLNSGSIQNKGFEFAVTYRDTKGKLDYSVTANLSTVKNEVIGLGNNSEIFAASGVSRTVVGKSIGQFWGYVTDGLYTTQEQLDADKAFAPNAALGDIRFKNRDGNGVLNDDDKDFIGNPIPKFTYGLSADLNYETPVGLFDFSMIWQGSYGNDIYNNTRYFGEGMYHYYNCFASTKNRYRAEDLTFINPVSGVTTFYPKNTNTTMPRAVLGDPNQNMRQSDRYVEDGSYLRLKALTIGYTLPKALSQKVFIDKLRIYVGAKNLLTFTNYSGFDPEVGDQDKSSGKNLSRGVDGLSSWDPTFPNSREFFLGLQCTF